MVGHHLPGAERRDRAPAAATYAIVAQTGGAKGRGRDDALPRGGTQRLHVCILGRLHLF